jgi:hypothetical protein
VRVLWVDDSFIRLRFTSGLSMYYIFYDWLSIASFVWNTISSLLPLLLHYRSPVRKGGQGHLPHASQPCSHEQLALVRRDRDIYIEKTGK